MTVLDTPALGMTKPPVQPRPARQLPPVRIALFPARAFLALGWLRAGAEKTIAQSWWNGQELRAFLAEHEAAALPFTQPIAALIGSWLEPIVAALVLVAEFAIGLCLLTGKRQRGALWSACALNIAFVAFGAVTPSAFYLVLQATLLFGLQTQTHQTPTQAQQRQGLVPTRRRWLIVAAGLTVAAALIPFVTTLHPAEVIHDPAIMLATIASLAAVTQTVFLTNGR